MRNVRYANLVAVALLVVTGAAAGVPTTHMAPVEAYLMERAREIALARTAAPSSISKDATVLVLTRTGFETAVTGTNGFVCVVERSWTSAPPADFWNPKVQTPICWNALAARSMLARNVRRTASILAGRSPANVDKAIVAAINIKEFPAVEAGGLGYMMSKQGYGGDTVAHWPSHVMFYFPLTDPLTFGAGLPGSPIAGFSDPAENVTMFAVGVQHWSDGTESR